MDNLRRDKFCRGTCGRPDLEVHPGRLRISVVLHVIGASAQFALSTSGPSRAGSAFSLDVTRDTSDHDLTVQSCTGVTNLSNFVMVARHQTQDPSVGFKMLIGETLGTTDDDLKLEICKQSVNCCSWRFS